MTKPSATMPQLRGDNAIATLCAGLDALGAPVLLLDGGQIAYASAAAGALLCSADLAGRDWAAFWETIAPDEAAPDIAPRRVMLLTANGTIPAQVSRQTVAGTTLDLVTLHDLTPEEGREYEVLRVFRESQEQADDLFALYQITQFLSTATRLDQLCATFLRELERITAAEIACLYLSADDGLQPHVCHGLDIMPPTQPNGDAAAEWLWQYATGLEVLALPLLAGDHTVGLALLAHGGVSARDLRFLHTVAKEMGTALLAMQGRQALLTQEQKLEAIVAGTTDAIIQVDSERRVRDFNPAAAHMTGLARAAALGQSCGEVLGCKQAGGCENGCPFAQVLLTREPIPYAEMRVGKRDLAVSVAALDLGPESAPAAVAIMRDISRQKQVEQMKADFFAAISHQLRTPLALLRGYSDTLLHLQLSPAERDTCAVAISDATGRLERLVEQTIEVTRIEEGHMQLRPERLRFDQVLSTALGALPPAALPERVSSDLSHDLPPIKADPQRLEQALINLLDNALKYSPPASTVRVRARRAGERIMVQVEDDGIGIPSDEQNGIFTKFYRASNARQSQLPGTGLGLFVTRSIIEAHGGHIILASAPGMGSCFTFWIPVAESEDLINVDGPADRRRTRHPQPGRPVA